MFTDKWMVKENVARVHNGILFSHKKCDSIKETGGHYVKFK